MPKVTRRSHDGRERLRDAKSKSLWSLALLAVGACGESQSAGTASSPGATRTDESPALRVLRDLSSWDAASREDRVRAVEQVGRDATEFAFRRFEAFSSGSATHEVAVFVHPRTAMEFVLVPVGTFRMGSPPEEPDRKVDEVPHSVTLTKPFLVCRTECAQAAYAALTADALPPLFSGDDLPRVPVSWNDAADFCARAGLALPTEAEWEWACRAATTTAFGFGPDPAEASAFAWCGEGLYGMDAESRSHPVAQKRPNAFGLFDVHGNVAEWCSDWYGDYAVGPVIDPSGPAAGRSRVVRGEYWFQVATQVRSAYRNHYEPRISPVMVGFRPIRRLTID